MGQFVDDVLDFTGSTMQLGKPALNDLRSGLATAPVLYAAEEHPQVVLDPFCEACRAWLASLSEAERARPPHTPD